MSERNRGIAARVVVVLTPLVEPLSIDEAFMDLSGTQSLHHASPAGTLARLARQVEDELSITVSIGLSYNKFLAKIASDLDKPRGFAVIGRVEARSFLAGNPTETNRPRQRRSARPVSPSARVEGRSDLTEPGRGRSRVRAPDCRPGSRAPDCPCRHGIRKLSRVGYQAGIVAGVSGDRCIQQFIVQGV